MHVQVFGQPRLGAFALDEAGERHLGGGEVCLRLADTLVDQFDRVGVFKPVLGAGVGAVE